MTMTHLRSIDRRLHRQRGGVAIWFALLLPVLLGFAALAVDLARLHLVKVELQSAADAAAMGGARSLTDAGGDPFNWAAAEAKALELAQQNVANGAQIQNATIETGYWNLQSRSWSGTFVTGYLPAVRATIAISDTQNNGPLNLLFAPILGIADSNVEASATAVIAPPAGGTGLFPFAISQCILGLLWDSETNRPKLDSSTGQPYTFKIGTPYPETSCYTGQWTTFDVDNNSASYVRNLIKNEVIPPPVISIGDDTWIQPGVKASNYKYIDEGIDVALVVVDNVVTHAERPVVAIVGFHISEVYENGNHSYVKGHFIDPKIFPNLEPGAGNGVQYGAYTPPILVK